MNMIKDIDIEGEINLTSLTQSVAATEDMIRQVMAEYSKTMNNLEQRRATLKALLEAAKNNIDVARLIRGEEVLGIKGKSNPNSRAQKELVQDALKDVALGCPQMMKEYFGLKNYDRWTEQGSNHTYGCVPRHGSIVYSIELKQRWRGSNAEKLTPQHLEDALYLLYNIDVYLDMQGYIKAQCT